jgi:ubiquinone biosynthesis protein
LPKMPRLVRQFLTQQTEAEQEIPMRQLVNNLILQQKKQARWQKRLTLAIILLLGLQLAGLAFLGLGII